MQFHSAKDEDETDPILPLINVVFLLLIFFIMTGALHAVDFFNVNPPDSSSLSPGALEDTIILVGSGGRVAIDNEEVDDVDLQLAISDKVSADPDSVFRIKADGRVDAVRVVEVMELVEAVGVRGVTLLTLEPDE